MDVSGIDRPQYEKEISRPRVRQDTYNSLLCYRNVVETFIKGRAALEKFNLLFTCK